MAEIKDLSAYTVVPSNGHFDITYVAPDKPRAGDIRYADGMESGIG